nr:uncharacterized protein CI109_005783 [Kwoniella shandongensis]KAA5525901.1 hypothetical protein CI109_005783 [Kwoniella shandongensis]
MPVKGSDIVLILVAIIFPPAAAAMITGCSCDLLINILLTVLVGIVHLFSAPPPGYLPGHIHAFWLIYKRIKAEETYGHGGYSYLGNGNFVGSGPGGVPPAPGHQQQYYGSTGR